MGRVVSNNITSSFSGQLGDDLVFRRVGNQTFFVRKGRNTKGATTAQNGTRILFAEAHNYASQILEDPEYSEWYGVMAKLNGLRTAQLAAMKDYMSKPEIEMINTKNYRGNIGDVILIKPKMLLKIQCMEITIYASDGSIIESGNAVKSELNWKFKATALNATPGESEIVVVAYDRFDKSCRVVS